MAPLIESTTHKPRLTDTAVGILRERILSGHYSPGEWFPAERELTEDLNVHRRVIRAAISQLEREGLLVRRRYCRPIIQAVAPVNQTPPEGVKAPSSRLVALVMYHGGHLEQNGSAQQRIFWSMNQALGRAGYHAVFLDIEDIGTEQENAEREAAHLQYVIDHGFSGIVFYAYAYNKNRDLIREVARRMPLVLIDRTLPGIDADFVGVQNFDATFEATKYLAGLGHERIAYITKSEPINTVQDRLQGYLHALKELYGSDFYEMVLATPSVGIDWPAFDTVFGLPSDKRPTAAICVNDYEAARVSARLDLLGLRVPKDVSVMGYDDVLENLPGGPALSTVAQPFDEIGKAASRLLLRRFENPGSVPLQVELPSRLVLRESTIAVTATSTAHSR